MSRRGGRNQPPLRLNRKDLDSSVYRLSRVREQYKANKAVRNEKNDSFVLTYYKQKPDELDTRSPEEKLADIQERLSGDDVPQEERHRLLAQQKQLCYFAHGEESAEMLKCEKELGLYYNRNHRPASAVRHLSNARNLEKKNNVEPQESMEIAVEIAEACLSLRDVNKRQETMKRMAQANEALQPVMQVEVEDLQLMYRRDLAQARVTTTRGRFEQALGQYDKAMESLEKVRGQENAEVANLYVEMADVAEADENEELAGKHYKSAHGIYVKLGMEEEARSIEDKLPPEQHVEEEEEEEKGESGSQHSLQEAPPQEVVARETKSSGSDNGIQPGSDVQPLEKHESDKSSKKKSDSSDSEKSAKEKPEEAPKAESEQGENKQNESPRPESAHSEKKQNESPRPESDAEAKERSARSEPKPEEEKHKSKEDGTEYYSYESGSGAKKPKKENSHSYGSEHEKKAPQKSDSYEEYSTENSKNQSSSRTEKSKKQQKGSDGSKYSYESDHKASSKKNKSGSSEHEYYSESDTGKKKSYYSDKE